MRYATDHAASEPTTAGGAWEAIARCIRALLVPSPALFCECNQERLREHGGRLRALDAALEDRRKRGFAAATRLLSLDPQQQNSSHAEITSPGGTV